MKFRSHLGLLALGAILPLAIFGAIAGAVLIQHDQDTLRQGIQARTYAVMTAVDSEIGGSIATALALGASLSIDAKDFAAFREVAERILATQPNWSNINLALPSGQQVVNLKRPQGSKLHSIAGVDDSLERILRTRAPVVNDLGFGPVTQQWDIAVRVPIIRNDEVRYILTVIVKPESLTRLLQQQQLPGNGVAVLVDGKGRIIARSVDAEALIGQPASEGLRKAMAGDSSGWNDGVIREGTRVYAPYFRSGLTGWTVAIGIPAETVDFAARRAGWLIVAGLLCALGLALALAYFVARRILQPIEALSRTTADFGRGVPTEVPDVERGPAEIKALAVTLGTALGAMRDRQELVEREKKALRSADAAKDEFIAMLSHELRNPLSAMVAASSLLSVGASRPNVVDKARDVITRQTKHMTRLIEDILDVSRVTMGKAGLAPEVFELSAALQGWLGEWRAGSRLDAHSVTLRAEPVWVLADPSRVEQIVSNLLDNAVKFTPAQGGIRITLSPQDGAAQLEVADEGEGLAGDLLERVFEPFFQSGQRPGRTRGGLGIGLALVRRLVQIQGGDVIARSAGPGHGTTFIVRLPAVPPPPGDTQERAAPSLTNDPRRQRILIVEDNEDGRQMLAGALALRGHEVHSVPDGETALEAVDEFRPEAVLIDIGLPGIDGYEVARRLRATAGRPLTLVALTGYGQPEDRLRAQEAGFDQHLTKPAFPAAIEAALAPSKPVPEPA